MIHLHGAHGYLLGSFLSPYSNRRTDEYGGTPKRRARFALEVLAAVREVVGPDFPIGYRMSRGGICRRRADDRGHGGVRAAARPRGNRPDRHLRRHLRERPHDHPGSGGAARAVSCGTPQRSRGRWETRCRSVSRSASTIRISPNEVMRRERLDFVSLSRAFHADPNYLRKVEEGRTDEIVPCIACHHCTNLLEANRRRAVPRTRRRAFERRPTNRTSARRARYGGGRRPCGHARRPNAGGTGAARSACMKRRSELGGQMRYSSGSPPITATWLRTWRANGKLKVDVRLRARMSRRDPRRPDAVVVATGARLACASGR